ncbi:MAG: DUF1287 domain-containing protein [Clostridiaceae bacterium]
MKKKAKVFAILVVVGVAAIAGIHIISANGIPSMQGAVSKLINNGESSQKYYKAEDFGITVAKSQNDCNNNGIDDYTDILLGARADADNRPRYRSDYYQGGYPPDTEGVCTDVIWRAFKNAGYLLKDMVDEDIENNVDDYPRVNGSPDPNIDFRRVPNLKVFFERHALSLTLDPEKTDQWQPGDIVTYGDKHIAIVSDRRNKDGRPYIIHNLGQYNREEDALTSKVISGHFRFIGYN